MYHLPLVSLKALMAEWSRIVVGGFVCYIIYKLATRYINDILLSPLRDIPGPLPAKLSPLWMGIIDFVGLRSTYLLQLHERYGDIVRCGPNEVSFTSADAARDVFLGVDVDVDLADHSVSREAFWKTRRHDGASVDDDSGATSSNGVIATVTKTFPKSPVYDILGKPSVFRTRDEEAYRKRLRRVGHAFSSSLLPDMEGVMRAEIAHLLRAMERCAEQPVNMLHWFRMLSLDITGRLFLDKSFGALIGDSPPAYVKDLDTANRAWLLQQKLPLFFKVLRCIPIESLQDFLQSGDRVEAVSANAIFDYIARYGRSNERRLPLTRLVAGNVEKGIEPLSDDDVVGEIMSLLFAGTDTTGTTLAYLFYELACHPQWYARLRAELAAATMNTPSQRPDLVLADAVAQKLPVLNAVIWETLRLHPAVPIGLPRVAPKGGALVAGHFMPAGTAVSVLTRGLQRTAAVFPNPGVWDPQRWLPPTPTTMTTAPPRGVAAIGTTTTTAAAAQSPPTLAFEAAGGGDGDGSGGGSGAGLDDNSDRSGSGLGDSSSMGSDGGFGGGFGSDAMRAHMLVFSRGQRVCLGRAIGLMQLRLTVSAMAQRFARVRLASEQTNDDMQMRDHLNLTPKGRKCMLVLE